MNLCIQIEAQVPPFTKKINKLLRKNFKHQSIILTEIDDSDIPSFPNRRFYNILDQAHTVICVLVVNKAYGCHIEGCNDPSDNRIDLAQNAYEEFYYAIIINPDQSIKSVKILEYDSDYGYEICSKRWLKQFQKINPSDIRKDYNIDGITGATVSVNSIVNDIINLGLLME